MSDVLFFLLSPFLSFHLVSVASGHVESPSRRYISQVMVHYSWVRYIYIYNEGRVDSKHPQASSQKLAGSRYLRRWERYGDFLAGFGLPLFMFWRFGFTAPFGTMA